MNRFALHTFSLLPRALPQLILSLILLSCAGVASATAATWKPEPLPRDQEIAAALEAGSESIREGAGVYVLTSAGFDLARKSSNGFHCIVGRSQPTAFEPMCFDAEGSETLLQEMLLRARLRGEGMEAAAMDRAVGEAWAAGSLRAPARPGINYMLSPRNRVPVGPGQVIPYRPHVMFYVPYLKNEDVGGDMSGRSPVFVINEGEPGAYVIVPVPGE